MDYILRAIIAIVVAVLLVTYLLPVFGLTGVIDTLLKLAILVMALWYAWSGPAITGK